MTSALANDIFEDIFLGYNFNSNFPEICFLGIINNNPAVCIQYSTPINESSLWDTDKQGFFIADTWPI